MDPDGLYSLKQGLEDTARAAWVFGALSALTPGGQGAALTFATIGFFATALELGLYSNDPFWDGIREAIKMLIPLKDPIFDKTKDEVIDMIYDELMENIEENADSNACP